MLSVFLAIDIFIYYIITYLLLLLLFSKEVNRDTVLLGTCGAEAILLWLLDCDGLAIPGSDLLCEASEVEDNCV